MVALKGDSRKPSSLTDICLGVAHRWVLSIAAIEKLAMFLCVKKQGLFFFWLLIANS